jgi:hypothetical protein
LAGNGGFKIPWRRRPPFGVEGGIAAHSTNRMGLECGLRPYDITILAVQAWGRLARARLADRPLCHGSGRERRRDLHTHAEHGFDVKLRFGERSLLRGFFRGLPCGARSS